MNLNEQVTVTRYGVHPQTFSGRVDLVELFDDGESLLIVDDELDVSYVAHVFTGQRAALSDRIEAALATIAEAQ